MKMLKLNNASFLVICTQVAIICYRFISKQIHISIFVYKSQLLNRLKTKSTVAPSIARAVLLQKEWILIRKQPSKKYSRRKFPLTGKEKQKVFSLLLQGTSQSSLVGRSEKRTDPGWRGGYSLAFRLVKSSLKMRGELNGRARRCQIVGKFFCAFFLFFLSKRGNNVCRAAVVHSGSVRKSGAGYLKDRYFYYMLFSENKFMQENHFLR